MPTPATISEALYLATYLHAFVRMQGAIDVLTHSATVNHGGGLRKEREQVWANPVHYAHQMARPLAGGTPVKVAVRCESYATRHSFGTIPAHESVPVLDALAVLDESGRRLIVSVVNRSAALGPIDVTISPGGLPVGPQAEQVRLCGDQMYDQNTLDEPARIVPRTEQLPVSESGVQFSMAPFCLVRLTFDLAE
jgi:alpha-N-arabinofuranosidase